MLDEINTQDEITQKNEEEKENLKADFESLAILESGFKHVVSDYIKRLETLEEVDIKKAKEVIQGLQHEFEILFEKYRHKLNQSALFSLAEKKQLIQDKARETVVQELKKLAEALYKKFAQYLESYGRELDFSTSKRGSLSLAKWNAIIDFLNKTNKKKKNISYEKRNSYIKRNQNNRIGNLELAKAKIGWKAWIWGGESKQRLKGKDGIPLIEVTIKSPGWFFLGRTGISSLKLLTINDETLSIIGALAGRSRVIANALRESRRSKYSH